MKKYRGETERGRQDDEEVSGRDRKEGGRTMKKYRGETERGEAGWRRLWK